MVRHKEYISIIKAILHDDSFEIYDIKDWSNFFDFCLQQAIVGVVFEGIQNLPPKKMPPQNIILEWIALSESIKSQNVVLNQKSAEIIDLLHREGLHGCILKGQGNSQLYPNPLSRTPGDIDVWIDADRQTITNFVRKIFPYAQEEYQHIKYPIFKEAEVELHYIPSRFNNPYYSKKLQKYFADEKVAQFNHFIKFSDKNSICIPTNSFNRIYQMTHIMYHFFNEGIGLRQIIDYYYLLQQSFTEEERASNEATMKYLNMSKFASGIMWILKECLGLEERYLIITPNKKIGKIILNEIICCGNFGKFDNRYKGRNRGLLFRNYWNLHRIFQYANIFPSEVLCRPIAKIGNQKWRVKFWLEILAKKWSKS